MLACARTKLAVVAADERDDGARQVLNLGHTVGHAIETVTGYGRYRHGEAVGSGLLAALRLSGRTSCATRWPSCWRAHGLPTRLEGVEPAAVVDATAPRQEAPRVRPGGVRAAWRRPGDVAARRLGGRR